MEIGFTVEAAKPKVENPEDAPSRAPMAPRGSDRRSPSTDQIKARRQMAKSAAGGGAYVIVSWSTGQIIDGGFKTEAEAQQFMKDYGHDVSSDEWPADAEVMSTQEALAKAKSGAALASKTAYSGSDFEGGGMLRALWIAIRDWIIGHNGYSDYADEYAFASLRTQAASQDEFDADMAKLNEALAPWARTLDDGAMVLDPGAPADLVATYNRLMQYGYANGLMGNYASLKESTSMNPTIDQQIGAKLAAMASAPLDEQRKLAEEVAVLRQQRTAAIQADREIDLGAQDYVTTMPFVAHSTATDWLGEDGGADLMEAQRSMAAYASKWYMSTSASVREDAEEFQIQARGMANSCAGAHAPYADVASDAFVRHALFLNRGGAQAMASLHTAADETVCASCGKVIVKGADSDKWYHQGSGVAGWVDDPTDAAHKAIPKEAAVAKTSSVVTPAHGAPWITMARTASDEADPTKPWSEQAGTVGDVDTVVEGEVRIEDGDEVPFDNFAAPVAPENAAAVAQEGERTPMTGAGEGDSKSVKTSVLIGEMDDVETTCPNESCSAHGVSFVHDDLSSSTESDGEVAHCPECDTPLIAYPRTTASKTAANLPTAVAGEGAYVTNSYDSGIRSDVAPGTQARAVRAYASIITVYDWNVDGLDGDSWQLGGSWTRTAAASKTAADFNSGDSYPIPSVVIQDNGEGSFGGRYHVVLIASPTMTQTIAREFDLSTADSKAVAYAGSMAMPVIGPDGNYIMNPNALASRRTAADGGSTCSVCGDSITRDPEGEENRTWHHTNGTSHDHEAKPSEGTTSLRTQAGVYCNTHQVWVGDGNAATHEGCSKEQKATDKTKEAGVRTHISWQQGIAPSGAEYFKAKVDGYDIDVRPLQEGEGEPGWWVWSVTGNGDNGPRNKHGQAADRDEAEEIALGVVDNGQNAFTMESAKTADLGTFTCADCGKTEDGINKFPGDLCPDCYAKSQEGAPMPTAQDIVEMWGGTWKGGSAHTADAVPGKVEGEVKAGDPNNPAQMWPWELPEGDVETGKDAADVANVATPGGESGYPQAKTSATTAPEGVDQALWDAAAKDASLGVGHVWTNVACKAYRTLDPADCTCIADWKARQAQASVSDPDKLAAFKARIAARQA